MRKKLDEHTYFQVTPDILKKVTADELTRARACKKAARASRRAGGGSTERKKKRRRGGAQASRRGSGNGREEDGEGSEGSDNRYSPAIEQLQSLIRLA